MLRRHVGFGLLLSASIALAQLPESGTLSDDDLPSFRAEANRVEELLHTSPDQAAVTYQLARTWAAAKQWPETMGWLRMAVGMRVGLDPSRDPIFTALRSTREFDDIISAVRAVTPAVSHSSRAFAIADGDLVPESMAYDPKGKQFYLGSMKKGTVARCSPQGDCTPWASGLGVVLGLKVHGDELWILSNSPGESALIDYDLSSSRVRRKCVVAGSGHNFNDLVIASNGDVYVTDTPAGAVWQLKTAAGLTRRSGHFEAANGIALSPDENLLYVSTFPDGITVVDLKSNIARPIVRPKGLCLAFIDGLYSYRATLIAIQNGYMNPRVVRLRLDSSRSATQSFEVLERRNPLFEGVTTGAIAGSEFFYLANIQDDKEAGFNPITVLKLRL